MDRLAWLVIWLSLQVLRHGVKILGSPGSGKSVLLKVFRATLAALMGRRPDADILLADYDTKRDLYEIFKLFPDFAPIFDLNPFVWGDCYDLMGDVEDPRDIAQLAQNLIEMRANETQQFFPLAAQQVFRANMLRHWLVCPNQVTFADAIRSCNTEENMRRVASSHVCSKHVLALINKTDAGLSVIATLMNEMSKYEYVAALWGSNTKGRRVSVQSFLKNRFAVLSLPYDDKSSAVLGGIVRYLLILLQQRLLASGAKKRLVVFLLDELSLVPPGVNLDLTLVKGREAGACLVLAYQSQMHARAVHGKEKFDAMTGLMKTTVALNLPGREDAEYAAKCFGDHQGYMRLQSHSSQGYAWSEQFTTVENVTASMIQALPVPTPKCPVIEGYMATIPYKPFHFRISIPELMKALVPSVSPLAPPAPRDPRDFILPDFDGADLKRLKIPVGGPR